MTKITAKEIDEFEKIYRLNLINSITGYKSANLIGTKSAESAIANLAVFSSVIHLGSNPPLLGFVLRPTAGKNNTFGNIKETGFFTVNHLNKDMVKQGHQTSAKYEPEISEFDQVHLSEEYRDHFQAPFVREAHLKIACRYRNDYFIEENDCRLVIGQIENIYLPEKALEEDGFVDLTKAGSLTINGVDAYGEAQIFERLSYARPGEQLKSKLEN